MAGKYDSKRDETLHRLSGEGWFTASSGDVEAPTGHFSKTSIAEGELAEIRQMLEGISYDLEGLDLSDLVGHWLLVEDSRGFVHVKQFTDAPTRSGITDWTSPLLEQAYADLEAQYAAWSDTVPLNER